MNVIELSENLNHAEAIDQKTKAYQNYLNCHGYTAFLHGIFGDLWGDTPLGRSVWHSTYSQETQDSFSEFGMEADVSLQHCTRYGSEFWWQDPEPVVNGEGIWTNEQRQFICAAEDTGLRKGLTLPLPKMASLCSGIGLARQNEEPDSDHRSYWREHRGEILLSAHLLHQALTVSEIANPVFKLAPREVDVLSLSALGLQNGQVADRLGTTKRTVEDQLAAARAKLGIQGSSTTQAVAIALQFGLISI